LVGLQVSFVFSDDSKPGSREQLTADEAYETHPMNSKLYVGNMSFKTTEADLRDAFGQFGNVTDVYIANDRMTGRPRGFAFVTFSEDAESKLAVEKMNGTDLDGRQLTVNEARPKEESGGGRSYGASRGGAYQSRD
jgi:cold-inducible RNA-binding protein